MKYIIDIPNEMAEATARYWNETTNMTLVPYVELDCKAIEDEVWEFVRICLTMDGSDFVDAFDSCSYINLLEYSYRIAKARYEAWMNQKDEIYVGDEIKENENLGNDKAVILEKLGGSGMYQVLREGGKVEEWHKSAMVKTGRHFDEVEVLLKNMSGEE